MAVNFELYGSQLFFHSTHLSILNHPEANQILHRTPNGEQNPTTITPSHKSRRRQSILIKNSQKVSRQLEKAKMKITILFFIFMKAKELIISGSGVSLNISHGATDARILELLRPERRDIAYNRGAFARAETNFRVAMETK
jgi:hypothetical protein